MGLNTMSVSRKYGFALQCLQMHCFKSKTSYRCISVLPQIIVTVIIYPKTRFGFRRLGYSLFAQVYYYYYYYYYYAWHSLLQCSFMQPLWIFLFFHNPHHHHNISIRLIVCMFLWCIAYRCVSLCYSSDLPWYVKIASPTALSASARPGRFW